MTFNSGKILFYFLMFILLSGCSYSSKFKDFTAQNKKFSITYPPYLKKTQYLHPSAPMQVSNGYRDIYFLTDTMKNVDSIGFTQLFDSIKNDLIKSVKEPLVENVKDTLVNDMLFKSAEITGTIRDKRVLFYLNLAKGKKYIYHIAGWHFNSKRELWSNDMYQSIFSISENQ